MNCPHIEQAGSRRDFLRRGGSGFGALALAALLSEESHATGRRQAGQGPLPVFRPTATSVIWCFLDGGPSHIDLFDPKPTLNKIAGKPLPSSFKRPVTAMGRTSGTPLLACNRKFAKHGESGIWVSDWYPEIATCVDDIAVIRSCKADGLNHVGSVCQMNTGSILGGRLTAFTQMFSSKDPGTDEPSTVKSNSEAGTISNTSEIGRGYSTVSIS